MAQVYELRDRTQIYLIGDDLNQIIGSKLPSNLQVLKVLFYNLRKVKLNLRESASLVIKEVLVFWEKARIPVKDIQRCIEKLEKLHNNWRDLQKHAKRQSQIQKNKEQEFIDIFDDLFDLSHANALQIMCNDEDKNFLISQRKKGRPGYLGGIDYTFVRKQKKIAEREKNFNLRKKRHYEECEATFSSSNDDFFLALLITYYSY